MNDHWFRPKMLGWGFTPVTWQGWALSLAFVAALIAGYRFLPTLAERVIVTLALIAAFCAIAAGKTNGD